MKIMASDPITSWQTDGEKWKQCQISFSWALKSMWMVTSAMKLRHLLLGRKAMTNLDSMLKSRDITFLTKVRLVKAMVFLVVMYGCDSWTTKKAERQRIDAFKLWCWRRLLIVPWTARRSNKFNPKGNQLWIFIGRTGAEAEALILWPPDAKSWLIGKDTDAGKDWGMRRRGQQRMRWFDGITD